MFFLAVCFCRSLSPVHLCLNLCGCCVYFFLGVFFFLSLPILLTLCVSVCSDSLWLCVYVCFFLFMFSLSLPAYTSYFVLLCNCVFLFLFVCLCLFFPLCVVWLYLYVCVCVFLSMSFLLFLRTCMFNSVFAYVADFKLLLFVRVFFLYLVFSLSPYLCV